MENPPVGINIHVGNTNKVEASLNDCGYFKSVNIKPSEPMYSNVAFLVMNENIQWIHDLADQLGQISQDLRRDAEEKAAQAQAMANSGVFEIINPETGALAPR